MPRYRMTRRTRMVSLAAATAVALGALGSVAYADYREHGGYGMRDGYEHGRGDREHRGDRWEHRRGEREHGARAMQMFDKVDANHDGTVSKAEVDDYVAQRIKTFDKNGDGKLSLDEYKALWLDRTNQRMVRSFQRFDVNGDGEVTQDEMTQPFDRFAQRLDRNDDGSVSKDELRRPFGRRGD